MTMIVFESYRGYDISDKIQAVKVTEQVLDELYVALHLAGYSPSYFKIEPEDIIKLKWGPEGRKRVAAPGDYLIKDGKDGYMAMPAEQFEKNFARDV